MKYPIEYFNYGGSAAATSASASSENTLIDSPYKTTVNKYLQDSKKSSKHYIRDLNKIMNINNLIVKHKSYLSSYQSLQKYKEDLISGVEYISEEIFKLKLEELNKILSDIEKSRDKETIKSLVIQYYNNFVTLEKKLLELDDIYKKFGSEISDAESFASMFGDLGLSSEASKKADESDSVAEGSSSESDMDGDFM